MSCLANILLHLLHKLYLLLSVLRSYWEWLTWKQPAPLSTVRRRVPKHLALLMSGSFKHPDEAEEDMIECVTRAVDWCRTIGVRKLTVYDEHGVLLHCASRIEQRIGDRWSESDSSASEIGYPLTPPPSDYADSRPLSPTSNFTRAVVIEVSGRPRKIHNYLNVKKRRVHNRNTNKALMLCIISRDAAKPAIATAASSFVQKGIRHKKKQRTQGSGITVDSLNTMLECDDMLSSPDFMIVHSINSSNQKTPLELHGFPPWHIRLTEIYHSHTRDWGHSTNSSAPCCTLDEVAFREALDEYALAEFRFGK